MRLLITLSVLLFTQLFLNLAHAAPNANVSADQKKSHVSQAKPDERRKRKAVAKTSKKSKAEPVKEEKTKSTKTKETKKAAPAKLAHHSRAEKKTAKIALHKTETKKESRTKLAKNETKKNGKKAYGRHRGDKDVLAKNSKPITLSAAHKKRYQHAQQTAMTKLMHQVGKPYRWGGTSPNTGFDCSGLVYYAYKDLIRIKMPRTANEMYHLRDAAPVKRGELESGDLVFFRISKRGAADHVGVYLGNGKFIQSPRTGEDIKITSLGDDYWQDHYVGARRVMTPKTIR
ncbi:C40 family peptidase [Ewingella americana]|uniref:C40 family peptidase n=1 Tax=Ewingella americana TaxID=41202 RepID=UPI0012AD387D|nr:C40 family peptidase [Ewingella americana]MRT02907.1 hydrolase [Ewingella americana]